MPNRSNTIPRNTLTISFSLTHKCTLFSTNSTPTPLNIVGTLKRPLSGMCHAVRSREWLKSNQTGVCNTQRNVFAVELSTASDDGSSSENQDKDNNRVDAIEAAGLPRLVCLKYATGVEATASLRREASFYSKELAPLVGIAVPQFYGLFTGGTMAAPIACLLMELCASTATLKSTDEFARQAMLTVCKVHAAGIMHNTALDFRHFVMKEKLVFLVDFSCATVHECGNAHPVLYRDDRSLIIDDEHDSSECQELMNAEQNIFTQIGDRLLSQPH